VLLAAKSAPYATPTGQNTLFRLPREIRDIIYEYALYTTHDVFYPEGHIMSIDLPRNKAGKSISRRGLVPWLRTNKQICSEALHIYGSTRTFSAMYWSDPAKDSFLRDIPLEKQPPSSPLVFNANVIRKIAITKFISMPREDEKKFLTFLHCRGVKDLDVEIIWFRNSGAIWSDLTYEEQAADWDVPQAGCWDSKLKRIKTNYPTSGEKPEESEQAMAIFAGTERLARRLVGQGAEVVSELVEFDKCQKGWTKTLVVERRV
jgi:hypothetical protein